jgi:anti-anti-sigma regulatory factor
MSDWQAPGEVTVEQDASLVTVRITGNFHRDLPASKRDELRDRIVAAGVDAGALLVDLRDLVRLDSWGEGAIANAVDGAVLAGGIAAVLSDPSRPSHLRSLSVLLKRHGDRVRLDHDEPSLQAWLAGGQR